MTIPPSPAARTTSDPRIRHWQKGQPRQNFGDYLSELLAIRMLRYPKVEADVYHFIGSVIDDSFISGGLRRATGAVTGSIAFWGCGVRSERGPSEALRSNALFFGVRGPISRDILGLPQDTVLGDPGLLIPLVHSPNADVDTAGKTICIPHVFDERGDEELLALSGTNMVVRPVVDNDLGALSLLLDRIIAADFVLTASLHGAIIAFAFDRPFALWHNGHLDVPLKWRDFAMSVGFLPNFVPDLRSGAAAYEGLLPQLVKRSLAPMLEICPFSVRPAMLLRAAVADGLIGAEEAKHAIALLDMIDLTEDRAQDALLSRSIDYRLGRDRMSAALARLQRHVTDDGKRRIKRMLGRAG